LSKEFQRREPGHISHHDHQPEVTGSTEQMYLINKYSRYKFLKIYLFTLKTNN